MRPSIILITGVNGVGKTSLIPYLTEALPETEVHDFDERGVPSGADREWRHAETAHWLDLGRSNIAQGVSTIICGYMKPKEASGLSLQMEIPIIVCVLTANGDVLAQRIHSRYQTEESIAELYRTTGKTVEKFIEDNIYITEMFEAEARDLDYALLDTSALTSQETCAAILDWLKDN